MSDSNPSRAKMPTNAVMQRAVAARDAEFDGAFVCGVVTTGVYCRPSCASRPALPKNRRFFAHPGSAEEAGYRACKRCKPRALHDKTVQLMQTLARFQITGIGDRGIGHGGGDRHCMRY